MNENFGVASGGCEMYYTLKRKKAWRKKLLVTQSGRCFYCRSLMDQADSKRFPTLDHLTPASAGGLDALCNLVLACRECNTRKGNLPLEVFLRQIPQPEEMAE